MMERNPYVGPRPFERGDSGKFYGREREARELTALVMAEREVLVYAPSGAGKTSLFNAKVIPDLEAAGFAVLPVARVGSPAPVEIDPARIKNIFTFSALVAVAGEGAEPGALLEQTLPQFLAARPPECDESGEEKPQVLIFDQFEEIFTAHRPRWREAEGFFNQVRQALEQSPRLGIVFSMREDHLAGLDPYLPFFRSRLRARFRLDLLGQRGALAAITAPAQQAGNPFEPEAARLLVDDLCRVKVRDDQGNESKVAGATVEPVQLQVVCSELWERLPEDGTQTISIEDVRQYGDVDTALIGFYQRSLERVGAEAGLAERAVRSWFDDEMITPFGTRGLVLRGETQTGTLPNAAVDILQNQHLIRAEARAGSRWYEIAHDRLVDPIRKSNAAWDLARQTPLRKAAGQWRSNQDAGLLYRGKALLEARQWAEANPAEVEEAEKDFLEASAAEERRAVTRRRRLMAVAAALGVIALVMLLLAISATQNAELAQVNAKLAYAQQNTAVAAQAVAVTAAELEYQQRQTAVAAQAQAEEQRNLAYAFSVEAERQKMLAIAREYAAQARVALTGERPQQSLLLALQSLGLAQANGEPRLGVAEQILRETLGKISGVPLQGHTDTLWDLAASPDGRWLATASWDGTARLWDLSAQDPGAQPVVLSGHTGFVMSASFSPDGQWLVTASKDQTARLWDLSKRPVTSVALKGHTGDLTQARFSPDGRWIATISYDATVILWDASAADITQSGKALGGHANQIHELAFSPDGRWLATGDNDGLILLWDLPQASDRQAVGEIIPVPIETGSPLNDLSFHPGGRWLVSAGKDGRITLFDVSGRDPAGSAVSLRGHTGDAAAARFSPDGCWLATGGLDGRVLLTFMGTRQPGQVVYSLTGVKEVPSLAFSLEPGATRQLAVGSLDNIVRLYDLSPVVDENRDCRGAAFAAGKVPPPDARVVDFSATLLRGLDGDVQALAFSPGGKWLAAAGADAGARLWRLAPLDVSADPLTISHGLSTVYSAALSPDGRFLIGGGANGVGVWSTDDPAAEPARGACEGSQGFFVAAVPRPEGDLFAAACSTGEIVTWSEASIVNGTIRPQTVETLPGAPSALAFSSDGTFLLAAYRGGGVVLWKRAPATGAKGDTFPQVFLDENITGRPRAAVDAQRKTFAYVDGSNTLTVRGLANLSAPPLAVVALGEAAVVDVLAYSPDGRWLAAGARDAQVHLFDLEKIAPNQPPVAYLLGGYESAWIRALAFSPDGKWLAAGASDAVIRLWDLEKIGASGAGAPDPQEYSLALKKHEDIISTLVFSPDGAWLVSSAEDFTLRLWNMTDPLVQPVTLFGHSAIIPRVLVTGDSRGVISLSNDGTARFWHLQLEDLVKTACGQARRELTETERAEFLTTEPVEMCENPSN